MPALCCPTRPYCVEGWFLVMNRAGKIKLPLAHTLDPSTWDTFGEEGQHQGLGNKGFGDLKQESAGRLTVLMAEQDLDVGAERVRPLFHHVIRIGESHLYALTDGNDGGLVVTSRHEFDAVAFTAHGLQPRAEMPVGVRTHAVIAEYAVTEEVQVGLRLLLEMTDLCRGQVAVFVLRSPSPVGQAVLV